MLYDHEQLVRAVQRVLDHHRGGDCTNEGLAALCIEAITPEGIPSQAVDVAVEAYDPNGITTNRRERMRQALEAVFSHH